MSLTAQSSYQCDCHFRMQADGCEDIVFIGGMLVLTFFQRPSHSLRRCTVTASTRATSRTAAPVSLAVHDLPRRSTRSTVPTMQHSVPAQTMPVLNAQGKPTQHRADPRPATRSRKPAALRDGNGRTLPTAHVSRRVLATDPPVIVRTKQLMSRAPADKEVLSLAQGIVHWQPPPAALEMAGRLLHSGTSGIHGYGPDEGLPALREALKHKLATRNGLPGYEVMVTAGANQAFVNLVLTLTDASDKVVLFKPYYFNHIMALQMSGGAEKVLLGPCDNSTLHPDLGWLQEQLQGPDPPKMVVIVNPCNPTGVLLPRAELQAAADLCAAAGSWLILDNTYEDFVYDGRSHHCITGPSVIHVFSFSKAYGMMGWRLGYLAYPGHQLSQDGGIQADFFSELIKVQDTIAVCPSQLSQHIGLAALQEGNNYLQEQIEGLADNRAVIADALSPLGTQGHGWVGGEGAIYYWAKLPERFQGVHLPPAGSVNGSNSSTRTGVQTSPSSDEAVVEWLVQEHGVCIIPGSACGGPGYVRVAFANLKPEQCEVAAARLKAGLKQLVNLDNLALV